jgi:hypothetical protein
VNSYLLSYYFLDLARERSAEAETRWREHVFTHGRPEQAPRVRRLAARMLAAVSLGSAWIARKLDSCVADDLGRSLAPAE